MPLSLCAFFYPALLLVVVAGALALRLPGLNERPMHADEAVQAAIFRKLWQEGVYEYDPNEFHGPTLPYATLPAVWIGGPASFAETTATDFRIVPVVFGIGLILLLWLLRDALGKPATLISAALLAISPAMVFYSRYFIHETLLIFFTLAAIGTGWRSVHTNPNRKRGNELPTSLALQVRVGLARARSRSQVAWRLAAGACLGLMQATKETSVIAFFAMGLALVLSRCWSRLIHDDSRGENHPLPARHLVMAIVVGGLVAVAFLSSFFTHPRGAIDGVLTYVPWLSRAGGASPHIHPWSYYLEILTWWRPDDGPVWSEGLILALAVCGLVVVLLPRREDAQTRRRGDAERKPKNSDDESPLVPTSPCPRVPASTDIFPNVPFTRWLGFYTLLMTAAYSAIPYKTPWCVLGPLEGMILLAGVGAVALVRTVPTLPLKALLACVLLVAAGQLAWQSQRTSHELAADPRNPYVYAHTASDVTRLADDVEQLAEAAPQGHGMLVKVIWKDGYYWPLPWYLRRFERVGYWTNPPADPAAPVVISSPEFDAALTAKLDETHLMTGYYAVRPGVLALLWVRMDVWEAHLRRLGRL